MEAKGQKIRALHLSQREIMMAQQVRPQSAQNTISLKLHLPGCTPQAVKEAADQVLDSADIFAASLCQGEHGWQMVYGEKQSDACSLQEADKMEQVEEQMAALDRVPMDVEKQLYQAVVMPLLEGGVYLYVRFHHVIIDGYGMSLFVQKVLDVLGGKGVAESVYVQSEKEQETAYDFWRGYFKDAAFEPSIFPEITKKTETEAHEASNTQSQSAKKAEPATGFGSIVRPVPDALMGRIEEFGRRENVTVPYIVAAAYSFYLAQASGKPDAVFLMPRLGRTAEQLDTLGCFTLLVPVRVKTDITDSFAALCRKTAHASREASRHKYTGFDKILSILREEGTISESLSEYVFNFYRFQYQTDLAYQVRFSVAGDMHNHLTFSLFYEIGRASCRERVCLYV